jgi:hypothetical protein
MYFIAQSQVNCFGFLAMAPSLRVATLAPGPPVVISESVIGGYQVSDSIH